MIRAAEILEREAKDIKDAHFIDGKWLLERLRADHHEMLAIAAELRRAAG
jgi:hypothetical protein